MSKAVAVVFLNCVLTLAYRDKFTLQNIADGAPFHQGRGLCARLMHLSCVWGLLASSGDRLEVRGICRCPFSGGLVVFAQAHICILHACLLVQGEAPEEVAQRNGPIARLGPAVLPGLHLPIHFQDLVGNVLVDRSIRIGTEEHPRAEVDHGLHVAATALAAQGHPPTASPGAREPVRDADERDVRADERGLLFWRRVWVVETGGEEGIAHAGDVGARGVGGRAAGWLERRFHELGWGHQRGGARGVARDSPFWSFEGGILEDG